MLLFHRYIYNESNLKVLLLELQVGVGVFILIGFRLNSGTKNFLLGAVNVLCQLLEKGRVFGK